MEAIRDQCLLLALSFAVVEAFQRKVVQGLGLFWKVGWKVGWKD
jgi:hypothetical protein